VHFVGLFLSLLKMHGPKNEKELAYSRKATM